MIQKQPLLSWAMLLRLSNGMFFFSALYTLKLYPSNRLRPLLVHNQMNPDVSLQILFTCRSLRPSAMLQLFIAMLYAWPDTDKLMKRYRDAVRITFRGNFWS